MGKLIVLLAVAAALLAFGCLGIGQPSGTQITPGANNTGQQGQQLAGNDSDAHGCIGSAGYTWCKEKNKCLRSWEEKCEIVLPAGAAPNMMTGDTCSQMNGRVTPPSGNSTCPEGEIPLAEVYSQTGAKAFCCIAAGARQAPPAPISESSAPPLPTTAPPAPAPPEGANFTQPQGSGQPS